MSDRYLNSRFEQNIFTSKINLTKNHLLKLINIQVNLISIIAIYFTGFLSKLESEKYSYLIIIVSKWL